MSIQVTSLEAAARRIVEMQYSLTEAMLKNHPDLAYDDFLFNAPSLGEVEASGMRWRYRKHGLGFTFVECNSGETIEMHDNFGTPNTIDAWRLQCYLEAQMGNELGHKQIEQDLKSESSKPNSIFRPIDATHYEIST